MDSEEERLVLDKLKHQTRKPLFIYVLTLFSAIGGFLFGYDTGIVSGAMVLVRRTFNLNDWWHELIVGITIAFAWVFSLLAGIMTDRWGRKPVVIVASFVFTGGSVIMGIATTKEIVLVGRLVVGIGIGLASMAVPMYIAEMAPPDIRGRLVTLNNVFITGGQFVASIIAGAFSNDKVNGWRYMLGLAGVPSFIQFFGFFALPESPRWLIRKGQYQQAITVLRKIRGQMVNIEEEFESVKNNCMEMEREVSSRGSYVMIQVLQNPILRRALMVGCMLQIIQQVAGINTVMYYSATIIEMSGVGDSSEAIWLASATAAMNFGCTFIGLYLVERIGRRSLTLGSLGGVVISLIVLAAGFYVSDVHAPPTTVVADANNGVCATYRMCNDCVRDTSCGFCFQNLPSGPQNGTCLLRNNETTADISMYPPCNATSLADSYQWAVEWCPSNYSWLILTGLLLYLFFFAPGMGPMPWTVNSEIYPLWARGTCLSVATSFTWLLNLGVSISFLTLTAAITKYGAFCLYAGLALLGWIFFYMMLPETKGKTLEEMEGLFAHPWWRDATTINDNKTIQNDTDGPQRKDTQLSEMTNVTQTSVNSSASYHTTSES